MHCTLCSHDNCHSFSKVIQRYGDSVAASPTERRAPASRPAAAGPHVDSGRGSLWEQESSGSSLTHHSFFTLESDLSFSLFASKRIPSFPLCRARIPRRHPHRGFQVSQLTPTVHRCPSLRHETTFWWLRVPRKRPHRGCRELTHPDGTQASLTPKRNVFLIGLETFFLFSRVFNGSHSCFSA